MKTDYLGLTSAILAIAIVGVGLSLTIPVIALRTEAAGFSAVANGLGVALSGVSTLFISPFVPTIVRRLGARLALFVALALNVSCLLGLAFIDDVWWWFPLRFLIGVALTVLFVISEYAVNALAPPARRGLWIGVYSTCLYLGFAIGPAILGFVGTEGRLPFYVAVALSLWAGAPIVWAGARIPGFEDEGRAPVLAMIFRSPAIMLAALLFGAVETGGMGLLPVHALRNGLAAEDAALLLTWIAVGNVAFQLPVGLLSDRVRREPLVVGIAALGLAGSVLLALMPQSYAPVSVVLFVWGGVIGGLYMVGLAALGARYEGADLASANAAFVMFYASGMLVGPPLLGRTLDLSPHYGLFGGMAALFVGYLVIVAIGRLRGA